MNPVWLLEHEVTDMAWLEVGVGLSGVASIVVIGLRWMGGWLKSGITSYVDAKARNLANREDFEKLLEQQRRTTEQLESIRSEITHNVWLKQRRWELRREAYANVLATLFEQQRTYGLRLGELRIPGMSAAAPVPANLRERFSQEEIQQLPTHVRVITTALATFDTDVQNVLTEHLTDLSRDIGESAQADVTTEKLLEITQRITENTIKTYSRMLGMAAKELQDNE